MSPLNDDVREKVVCRCMEELKDNNISTEERNNIFDFLKREVSFEQYYKLFRDYCPEFN